MARVFTTTFQYRGETYTAIIAQGNGALSIRVPDEKLHDVLPEGKLVFNDDQSHPPDPQHMAVARDLFVAILAAVEAAGGLPSDNTSAMDKGVSSRNAGNEQ